MVAENPRLVILHSENRSYRVPLFSLLAHHYDTQFYFLEGKRRSRQFPEASQWKYNDLHPVPMIGYTSDFCPSLIPELIRRRNSYDIIITTGLASFATHAAFPLSRALNKKLIVWGEDWVWSENFWFKLAMPYVRWIARSADALLAAGTKSKEFFVALGAPAKRVFIAQNCAVDLSRTVDQKRVVLLRSTFNKNNRIVIGSLGRIVEYKALDTLIKAYAALERRHHNVHLLIVGDGPFAPKCRDLIGRLALRNFTWPQQKKLSATEEQEIVDHREIAHYLAACDIVVLPGRFRRTDHVICESWGLILNEALSLGKPIISTTSVAAAYDLIDQGINGYRVGAEACDALSDALERLVNNPQLRESMGRASRRLFESRFQYPMMFSGFQSAISSVC